MRRRELLLLAGNSAFAEKNGSGWIKSSGNPMLSLGKSGDFDSQNIMSPSIVKERGTYYLFYAGGPLGPRNGGDLIKYQLGLALSGDGERWKKTGQPLLPLGERDNFHVTPTLLRNPGGGLRKQDGKWHMLYCGNREDEWPPAPMASAGPNARVTRYSRRSPAALTNPSTTRASR